MFLFIKICVIITYGDFMKLLFKNTTKYTKPIYDEFLSFHSQKYHFSYTLYTCIIVAFILFFLIVQVRIHQFAFVFLGGCILTAFILWRFFHPISTISKEYKSEKIQKEKEFTFKFYENYFTSEDEKEFSEMKYRQLYKIFETPTFFYLYIDKTHAFLLNKSTFKKDRSFEFSNFIQKKCWWKYRLVKQKTHKN